MFKKLLDDYNNKLDVWTWTEQYRYIKGKPWEFKDRDYLKQIYTDPSLDKIFVKGRQVEVSELSINHVLHFLTTHPYVKALYTFPTKAKCNEFGGERFYEAFVQSSKLQEELIDDGSVYIKKFKNHSYLYLQTASSGGDKARSISADMLICDEYQDFDYGSEENDTMPARDALTSNLDHSEYKKIITLGTPKLPGTHFEELWDTSTMYYWNVVCPNPKCGHKQKITVDNIIGFEESITDIDALEKVYFGCLLCREKLNRKVGDWLATNPKSLRSGYHLSQLITPWKSAKDIVLAHGTKYHKGKTIRAFNNEVIGNFYAGSAIPFNDTVLEGCYKTDETVMDGFSEASGTYMGVDWGDITTVCIITYDRDRDMPQIVAAKKISDPHLNNHAKEVAALMKPYNVRNVVVDIGYGKPQTQELVKIMPGRIWFCQSNGLVSQSDPYIYDQKKMKVLTDKNVAMGDLVGRAELGWDRDGGLCIPWDDKSRYVLSDPYLREMRNIIAKQENNKTRYEKNSGRGDHFAWALVYACIAAKGDTRTTKHSIKTYGVRLGRR